MVRRRTHSVKAELIAKSREAALSAIQLFNNPLVQFRSEGFIMLMVVAWTYLLHAHYRECGIEYRYFDLVHVRRRFHRSPRGAYKYWELERCLNDAACPVDRNTANNLRFIIGLRHEIEHQMSLNLDEYLSGRYQACCLNYNKYVVRLFGQEQALDRHLTYSLQLADLTPGQVYAARDLGVASNVKTYISEFDASLTQQEIDSPEYSFRLLFTRKLTGKQGQADRAIEFVDPNSTAAQAIDKEYWVQKEVEKPKFARWEVLDRMHAEGFVGFGPHQHTLLWKDLDAKNPGKGLGVQIGSQWFWYERWIDAVRKHCQQYAGTYQAAAGG